MTQTQTNKPSLQALAEDPGILPGLDLGLLSVLLDEAKATAAAAGSVSRAIQAEVESRLSPDVTAAYLAKGEDTGAVRIEKEGLDIEVNRPKSVEWDQTALAELHDRIKADGDNPLQYLTLKFGVDERKYTAWPDSIRQSFEAARTVKIGSVSVKMKPADPKTASEKRAA